ncbi:hypothetical protein WMY93_031980 [Mugilogobius chulae]|uniref:Uncharacterized protein n=1 Tax=Mugilogobius chulae TaxID=88201 RepID=A0AAW0MEK1_9GOBI
MSAPEFSHRNSSSASAETQPVANVANVANIVTDRRTEGTRGRYQGPGRYQDQGRTRDQGVPGARGRYQGPGAVPGAGTRDQGPVPGQGRYQGPGAGTRAGPVPGTRGRYQGQGRYQGPGGRAEDCVRTMWAGLEQQQRIVGELSSKLSALSDLHADLRDLQEQVSSMMSSMGVVISPLAQSESSLLTRLHDDFQTQMATHLTLTTLREFCQDLRRSFRALASS